MQTYSYKELLRMFKLVLFLFLIWRSSLFLFAFVGTNLTYEAPTYARASKDDRAFPSNYFVDGWFRWDSAWYRRIAEKGYSLEDKEGRLTNVVFFPLYPYLSRYLGKLLYNDSLAGIFISNVSTLLALFFIYLIGLSFLDEEKAKRSLILLLIFPGSFFLSAYYTEGLFLLTSSGSLYFFLKRNYLVSGLFGMMAMLTRPTGIILFAVFVVLIIYNRLKQKDKFALSTLYLLLIPCGVLVFMYVLHVQVNDPLAFAKYQSAWGRHSSFPLETLFVELGRVDLSFPRSAANMQRLIDTVCAAGFLIIALLMTKRYHPSLWLFVLFGILMPLSTGRVISMVRFASVLFPAFFWLSEIAENKLVERLLIYSFSFSLSLYNLLFINWYWAG